MKKNQTNSFSNKFNKAFESLMLFEGGYSNDKLDLGKETKYGLTKRYYPHISIKDLTIDQAKIIYHKDYWLKNNYDKIRSNKIAEKVFHSTVHAGSHQSHIILQRALHSVGFRDVIEDGILGNITLDSVNKSRTGYLLPALRSETAGFYRLLIANKPSQSKFRNGWLKRAYK